MRRKFIVGILVVSMLCSIFAGCSKTGSEDNASGNQVSSENSQATEKPEEETPKEKTGGKLVDEDTTLTIMLYSNYELDNDTWIFQKIKECTGISLKVICYTREVASEKLATYIAKGEIPDITVSLFTDGQRYEYGEAGALASPMDYLDVMPNFKALVIDDPDMFAIYDSCTTESGKNYYIPIYRLNRDVNFGLLYRADVFRDLGIEPWKPGDTEGFYNALVKLKEAYPASYPFTGSAGGKNMLRLAASWVGNGTYLGFDYDKGEWYLPTITDEYREFLSFFQKLYAEGLMDPEYFSTTLDSYNEAFLNGRSFVCNEWIGRLDLLPTAAAEEDPDTAFDMQYAAPIGNGKIPELEQLSLWGPAVANNENTEASMKLIDWLYSEEGSEVFTVGVEGENFEWDQDGKPVYPELEQAGITADITSLEEHYGMWIEGLYLHPDRSSCYFSFTEREQAAQDLINNQCGYVKTIPSMAASVADELQDEYNQLYTTYTTDVDSFLAEYITKSNYGDAQWEAYVKQVTDYGVRMLEILNQ